MENTKKLDIFLKFSDQEIPVGQMIQEECGVSKQTKQTIYAKLKELNHF